VSRVETTLCLMAPCISVLIYLLILLTLRLGTVGQARLQAE